MRPELPRAPPDVGSGWRWTAGVCDGCRARRGRRAGRAPTRSVRVIRPAGQPRPSRAGPRRAVAFVRARVPGSCAPRRPGRTDGWPGFCRTIAARRGLDGRRCRGSRPDGPWPCSGRSLPGLRRDPYTQPPNRVTHRHWYRAVEVSDPVTDRHPPNRVPNHSKPTASQSTRDHRRALASCATDSTHPGWPPAQRRRLNPPFDDTRLDNPASWLRSPCCSRSSLICSDRRAPEMIIATLNSADTRVRG